MENDIKERRNELTRLSDAVNRTQLELEVMEKKVGVKSYELDSLETEIESKEKDLDAFAVDREFIVSEIESLKKDKLEVQKEIESLHYEHGKSETLLKEKQSSLVSSISELESAFVTKQEAFKEESAIIERKIALAKSDFKNAMYELDTIKASIDSISVTRVAADKALIGVQNELAALVAEVSEKQIQSDSLANLVAITAEEKVALEQVIAITKDQISRLDEELAVTSEKVIQIKEELDVLDRQKFSFLEAKKALTQKELFIKNLYKEAGVIYPE